jgi:copper chaperone CopZ
MSIAHVAHDIPGRLRVRLPAGATTEGLHAAIATTPGVQSVTWSPRTRSVLVLYDPAQGSRDAILDALADVSGLETPPTPAATAMVPSEPGGMLALGVRQLIGEVDQRVQHATRGLVGLGGLFPVALTAWALTEVVRGRAAPLAWSSALWYAHGLFRDYQVPAPPD